MIKKGLIQGAATIQRECKKVSTNAGFNGETTYVLMSMIINLMERAQTIRLLTDENKLESIGVLTRSYVELAISLDYILRKETDIRAKSYLLKSHIVLLENIVELGKINPDYVDYSEDAYALLKNEVPEATSIDDVHEFYSKEHDKLYDNPENHSQKWFNLHGEKRKSFKDLMKSMGYSEDVYFVLYGIGSMDVHGFSSLGSVKKDKDREFAEGALPLKLCHDVVIMFLATMMENLAKYYRVTKNPKVKVAFKQMGLSSSGGNFNLYQSMGKKRSVAACMRSK